MTNRRKLDYQSWDDVVADIQSLAAGYEQHGKWNLEQASKHLNDWLSFPMDGFPPAPLPIRLLLFAMRKTVGKRLLRKIIAEGRMKDGVPTTPNTVYPNSTDEAAREAVTQLIETIRRFEEHEGQIYDSPIFGAMDKQTAQQLQFVHFAHHLSWLSPNAAR